MANTIQIKRGASIPPDGSLAPYELGVKTPEMELYIGDSDGAAKPVIAKGNWKTARSLAVYLSHEDIQEVDGSSDIDVGVQGVLPLTKGGTGATTTAQARQNLVYAEAIGMNGDTPQDHRSFGSGINYIGDNSFIINATTGGNMIGQIKLKCATNNTTNPQLSFRSGTAASSNQWFANNEWLSVITNKDIIPIANGGTGATTVGDARAKLGLGAVATLNTIPIANGGTGATTAEQALTNLGIDKHRIYLQDIRSEAGTTINLNDCSIPKFFRNRFSGTNTNAPSGITTFEMFCLSSDTGTATNQTSQFLKDSTKDALYMRTKTKGNFSDWKQFIHTGNHFEFLAQGRVIAGTTTEATTIEINDVKEYTAFIFLARTNGSGNTHGYNSIVIPVDFFTNDKNIYNNNFTLGDASDSKIFSVQIDANFKMTITSVSSINDGISDNSFFVYGIR